MLTLSAIVLAAGLQVLPWNGPKGTCMVAVVAGSREKMLVAIEPVGTNRLKAAHAIDLWLYEGGARLNEDGALDTPDLILHVTPGQRITIPPVTEQQRRECGGAVS